MEMAIGFGLAIVAGTVVALLLAQGEPREDPLPWQISDLARMQASLMATLAAVSMTGIVLLVGLSSRIGDIAVERIETLTLMFALCFGFFTQCAYTLSYLPDRAAVGERLQRLSFALATTLQWRTVVMLSLALIAIAELYELPRTTAILFYLAPVMIASVTIIIAGVSDALGLVRFGECFLSLIAGVGLASLSVIVLRQLNAVATHSVIIASIGYAAVSGSTYFAAGLIPLAPRRSGLRGVLTRHARRLAMGDMLATGVSIAFLWFAVAGVI